MIASRASTILVRAVSETSALMRIQFSRKDEFSSLLTNISNGILARVEDDFAFAEFFIKDSIRDNFDLPRVAWKNYSEIYLRRKAAGKYGNVYRSATHYMKLTGTMRFRASGYRPLAKVPYQGSGGPIVERTENSLTIRYNDKDDDSIEYARKYGVPKTKRSAFMYLSEDRAIKMIAELEDLLKKPPANASGRKYNAGGSAAAPTWA
jgi:hypothetical protein